ncbi:MAG: hypothetical protein AAGA53_10270 [Pseudomonadota bacterium]
MAELINGFVGFFGLSKALALVHLVAFVIAVKIWSKRHVARNASSLFLDFLGVLGTLLAFFMFLILMFEGEPNPSTGNTGTWFLIFSVVTLGLVPLLTLLSFFLSGRFVGRIMNWRRLHKMKKNLGRQVINP